MAKLIESIDTCGYSRCGRTDKGVSALGQVVGIIVRSTVPVDATIVDKESIDEILPGEKFQVQLANGTLKELEELDYCTALNCALPADIRVYAWAPAPAQFSARFNCQQRVYKYFFNKRNLDIQVNFAIDVFIYISYVPILLENARSSR